MAEQTLKEYLIEKILMVRYKGFIIYNSCIWFDEINWQDFRSFQIFTSKEQCYAFIDNYRQ